MKNIIKKTLIGVLSLSLMFSFSAPVVAASHAANGANIMPSDGTWTSFSVRDDLNYDPPGEKTEWGKALDAEMERAKAEALEEYKAGKITEEEYNAKIVEIDGWQSYTQARMATPNNSTDATIFCKNTGWDGEYAAQKYGGDKVLVADNPWGLTMTMENIDVEYGRYYTMDFDISSTLEAKEGINYYRSDKYCLVKAYDYQSKGEPAASFESFKVNGKEADKNGKFQIAATPADGEEVKTHITATFKIPDTKNEWSGGRDSGMFTHMGIKFALGAFAKTHENEVNAGEAEKWEEIALKGYVRVTNMKVLAGTQYAVRYYDGSVSKDLRYVNELEQAKMIQLKKKGYTLTGYTNMATGSKYNFGDPVMQDLNLKAIWAKTKKPKKATIKVKSKKKRKATVTFGKNKNAVGYQVKYSYSKKFKKKKKFKTKTKNTSSVKTYTIKSLKSSKVLYVKARAYNKDSCSNKYYGKWSKRKSVYVK